MISSELASRKVCGDVDSNASPLRRRVSNRDSCAVVSAQGATIKIVSRGREIYRPMRSRERFKLPPPTCQLPTHLAASGHVQFELIGGVETHACHLCAGKGERPDTAAVARPPRLAPRVCAHASCLHVAGMARVACVFVLEHRGWHAEDRCLRTARAVPQEHFAFLAACGRTESRGPKSNTAQRTWGAAVSARPRQTPLRREAGAGRSAPCACLKRAGCFAGAGAGIAQTPRGPCPREACTRPPSCARDV